MGFSPLSFSYYNLLIKNISGESEKQLNSPLKFELTAMLWKEKQSNHEISKYSNRQTGANSIDPDQTAPSGAV